MSKPKSIPVPEAQEPQHRDRDRGRGIQEPLSGSKKVKNRNHVDHNNPEGS
ncbi:small acid-soluble spore protein P [Paenibacillus sp. P96]|uniref:Small acid-soluble spore protein P n=1 Tax=Paenibacillus zeirhizosphaerae TaxID=2987519 RepID=A0ABT9FWZ0_9BACL|nr:small acid-soluble spore protein P [Paenibacillus sp. P96]MDP4099247.1 small acid-soluble spore protein P [Paenibacillus sp. P96]